jgi:hypothetical protein
MQFLSVLSTFALMATAIMAEVSVDVGTKCSPEGRYHCCKLAGIDSICVCSKGMLVIAHSTVPAGHTHIYCHSIWT